MTIRIQVIILILFLLVACDHRRVFRIMGNFQGSALHRTTQQLADFMNEDNWEFELIPGSVFETNANQVYLRNTDFALERNTIHIDSTALDVRTVLPLFPHVGMIIYRDTITANSLYELLQNRKIGVIDPPFFLNMFDEFGVDSGTLSVIDLTSNDIRGILERISNEKFEIICAFASLDNPIITNYLQSGWNLFSLGDIEYSGKGSRVEGFCLKNPKYYPVIIPKGTFIDQPTEPVLTIASDILLITHKSIAIDVIYDLVKHLLDHKQFLVQKEVLFNWMTEDFDYSKLNYPLHQGTIKYLSRNQPTVFERYAELVGVVFSITIVGIGLLARMKRRRKNRIDKYYIKVLNANSVEDIEELETTVINLMEREKIDADITFSSFINFAQSRKDTFFRRKET